MKSAVLFTLFFTYTYATPFGRITSGQNAVKNQFPYQVSYQWGIPEGLGTEHICGGALISPLYAITAGQCVAAVASEEGFTRVIAGIVSLNEKGVARDVVLSLIHPLYEGGIGPYDLALLRLESALPFSESIQPIALPTANSEPGENQQAIVSGWGSISTGSVPSYTSTLQYVQVSILSYDRCTTALASVLDEPAPLDEESNVCTGPLYSAISTCNGDNGGPLAQVGSNNQTELIGIVSWVIRPCGFPGAPSVYTKVSSFVDFIRENVPDLPDTVKYLNSNKE